MLTCRVFLYLLTAAILVGNAWPGFLYAQVYYQNDFDGGETLAPGVTGGISGAGVVESAQGYATLSPYFGGSFLRSIAPGNPAPPSSLNLAGLPAGASVKIKFSLAIIDSWDGSVFPPDPIQAPDYLNVRVNGVVEFSETFSNFSYLGSTQSYPDTALALEVPLGFEEGANRNDSAYALEVISTADGSGSLAIDLFASGSGWHAPSPAGPEEESWAIDNLSVENSETSAIPSLPGAGEVVLFQNHPNPFNPSTQLSFELVTSGQVTLKVYDLAGRLVSTLVDETLSPGHFDVIWNGRDEAGRMSSAGVFLYRLEAGGHVETKLMTLVK